MKKVAGGRKVKKGDGCKRCEENERAVKAAKRMLLDEMEWLTEADVRIKLMEYVRAGRE